MDSLIRRIHNEGSGDSMDESTGHSMVYSAGQTHGYLFVPTELPGNISSFRPEGGSDPDLRVFDIAGYVRAYLTAMEGWSALTPHGSGHEWTIIRDFNPSNRTNQVVDSDDPALSEYRGGTYDYGHDPLDYLTPDIFERLNYYQESGGEGPPVNPKLVTDVLYAIVRVYSYAIRSGVRRDLRPSITSDLEGGLGLTIDLPKGGDLTVEFEADGTIGAVAFLGGSTCQEFSADSVPMLMDSVLAWEASRRASS